MEAIMLLKSGTKITVTLYPESGGGIEDDAGTVHDIKYVNPVVLRLRAAGYDVKTKLHGRFHLYYTAGWNPDDGDDDLLKKYQNQRRSVSGFCLTKPSTNANICASGCASCKSASL
jgi:hypothetical protein